MRDTYQNIFIKYPTLTTFGTVATDDVAMITTLKKLFAKYRLAMPTDTKVSAARTIANTATSISNVHVVASNLEQSTANLMTRLLRTTRSTDVARAETLIRRMSLGSHTKTFAAEQATVAAHPQTTPRRISPFPAPVTTRTVTVPGSIDATGKTDVSAALNAFLATVPNGSIISFPTGATYLLKKGMQISKRHNLVFAGNGTTLKVSAGAAGDSAYTSPLIIGDDPRYPNTDIVVHDFILVGNSPTPGIYIPRSEFQSSLSTAYSKRVEIYNITGSAAPGDFLRCEQADDVWVHDCHAPTVGRNGISVTEGSNILVERVAFDISGGCTFDIEPNHVTDVCSDITLRNNTAGTWGYAFLALGSNAGGPIDKIVVDNNTVTGGSIKAYIGNSVPTKRMTRITFTNNKGTIAAGSIFYLSYIDGLTVTGNVQSLSSGVLTNITDCTGAR